MPRKRQPRRGSMQYWPRRRAKDIVPRVRSWPEGRESKPVGFPGYKVGMTHVMATDNRPNSLSKNEQIRYPVTVVECPPIKIAGIVFYTKDLYGLHNAGTVLSPSLDKELSRVLPLPKNIKKKVEDFKEPADVRLLVYTQPKLIKLKKKPELFELAIGGSVEDKIKYAQGVLGKEISIKDVFAPGILVDTHAVTTGRGFQGPVKRFGVSIRHHKSEKTKRGPGSLGPWTGERMFNVAHAGQTGYHTRTELNKWILKIDSDVDKINVKSGFKRYGEVKHDYMLLKGSIAGPSKRMIIFTIPQRPDKKVPTEAPQLAYVSQTSKI